MQTGKLNGEKESRKNSGLVFCLFIRIGKTTNKELGVAVRL